MDSFTMTASERTIILAPVVGAYLCLSAIGLLRRGELRAFLDDLAQHPGFVHTVGAIAFFAGAMILSWQRDWSSFGNIVLNLVAAFWAYEGAGMLASPTLLRTVFGNPRTVTGLRASSAIMTLVGVYLLFLGAFGEVG